MEGDSIDRQLQRGELMSRRLVGAPRVLVQETQVLFQMWIGCVCEFYISLLVLSEDQTYGMRWSRRFHNVVYQAGFNWIWKKWISRETR